MYTTLKLTAAHPEGSILSFDAGAQAWGLAPDATRLVGVVSSEPFEHEGAYYANVTFGGACWARASRDIAPQGGGLAVEDGGAYVGELFVERAGEVAPVAFDQPAPQAGDLVLIFLR
jgi:hypothetical protein